MTHLSLDPGCAEGLAKAIIGAAHDGTPVSGLTHGYYRYPARFSPLFVRAVIAAFTKTGDWVIDPFAGGGTTLVEAMAAGRNALGIDISSLATFVSEAKTLRMRVRVVDSVKSP
jgi:23S rRNA G2445 N2-methylase RlmL